MKKNILLTSIMIAALSMTACGGSASIEESSVSLSVSEDITEETGTEASDIASVDEELSIDEPVAEIELPCELNGKTYEKAVLENLCSIALPENLEIGEYSKYAGFGGGYLVGPQIYTDNWELGSDTLNMAFVGSLPKEFYVFKIDEEGFIDPETVTPSPKTGFQIIDFVEVLENTEKNCIIYSYTYDLLESGYMEENMPEDELGKFWISYIVEKEDEAALELKFSKAYFTLEEVELMAQSVRFE